MLVSLRISCFAAAGLLALALPAPALAKDYVVFIDLSGQKSEVADATRAASALGRTLLTLPTSDEQAELARLTSDTEAKLKPLRAAYAKLLAQAVRDAAKNGDAAQLPTAPRQLAEEMEKRSPELSALGTQIALLQGHRDDALDQRLRSSLETHLAALDQAGDLVRSVIVSGEHISNFWGKNGQLRPADISRLAHEHRSLGDSVRSVFALSCYSEGPVGSLNWKEAFPSLKLVAGYQHNAVVARDSEGRKYFTDMMKFEDALVRTAGDSTESDLAQVTAVLRKLDYLASLNYGIYLQTSSGRELYASKDGGVRLLSDAYGSCAITYQKALAFLPQYDAYVSGAQALPANTDTSPLRSFYDLLRGAEQCFDRAKQAPGEDVPASLQELDYNRVIRLLKFREVARNYLKDQQGMLDMAGDMLARLAARLQPGTARLRATAYFPTRDDVEAPNPRKAISQKLGALERVLGELKQGPGASGTGASDASVARDFEMLFEIRRMIDASLVNLNPDLIPDGWV